MADPIVKQISQLAEMTGTIALNDLLAYVDVSELLVADQTKKWTLGSLLTALAGAGIVVNGVTLALSPDGTTLELSGNTLQVKNLGITAGKLATNAVETAKIKDLNVTEGKLATGAVTVDKLGTGAVTANKIANRTRRLFFGLNETVSIGMAQNVTTEFEWTFRIPDDYISNGKLYAVIRYSHYFTENIRGYFRLRGGEIGDSHTKYDQLLSSTQTIPEIVFALFDAGTITTLIPGMIYWAIFGRDGAHVEDTLDKEIRFYGVIFEYTADS